MIKEVKIIKIVIPWKLLYYISKEYLLKIMKIQTKDDIITLVQQNKDHLKEFGVSRLGLFGSFIKEQFNEESDVDILVSFQPELKTFNNFMGLSILKS